MFLADDKTTNRSLADLLSEKMHAYDVFRQVSPNLQDSAARNCLMWIDKAFTYGVVKEGDSLINKLEEKDKQISSLKEEISDLKEKNSDLKEVAETLEKEYLDLQGRYNELKEDLNKMVPKSKYDTE